MRSASHRRTASMTVSSRVIQYLVEQGLTQADIARMLGVSQAYISLVKSRERALTLEHIQSLADEMELPLGALLLAVGDSGRAGRPRTPFGEKVAEILRLGDEVRGLIAKERKGRADAAAKSA